MENAPQPKSKLDQLIDRAIVERVPGEAEAGFLNFVEASFNENKKKDFDTKYKESQRGKIEEEIGVMKKIMLVNLQHMQKLVQVDLEFLFAELDEMREKIKELPASPDFEQKKQEAEGKFEENRKRLESEALREIEDLKEKLRLIVLDGLTGVLHLPYDLAQEFADEIEEQAAKELPSFIKANS